MPQAREGVQAGVVAAPLAPGLLILVHNSQTMNGRGTIIAIVGVGVGLGSLTAALGGMILSGQDQLAASIETNWKDIGEIRSDIADLRERMARLEGRVDTLVNVFVERED